VSSRETSASGFGAALLVAWCLSTAITYNDGAYSDFALVPIVLAFFVIVARFGREIVLGATRPAHSEGSGIRGLEPIVLAALVAMQFSAWNDPHLIMYARGEWTTGRHCELGSMALLLTYVPSMLGWRERRAVSDARFAIFACMVLAAGVATIHVSPTPSIDVWTVQQQGAEALLHGKNPFTSVGVHNTAPGARGDAVPYVYPPTQALVSTLAYALTKDSRYATLLAFLVAGLAMRAIARTRRLERPTSSMPLLEDAPALFLWLAPKAFFIVEQAWVDPVQLAFVSLALCAEVRGRRWLSVVLFGVLFSAKQSMFWFAPLAGFAFRWSLRQWIVAALVAASSVLPFAILDFKALKYANFDFLTSLPPRDDALTLVNWAQRKLGWAASTRYGFLGAAAVVGISSLRARGPARFATAALTTYFVFFVFNKWAFANYYFLIGGLAALAAAAALGGARSRDARTSVSGGAR
jgi:hypothetical protein